MILVMKEYFEVAKTRFNEIFLTTSKITSMNLLLYVRINFNLEIQ